MKLLGKVAVVTGAGSGFGEGIARLFAREGARVALLDIREARRDGSRTRSEPARSRSERMFRPAPRSRRRSHAWRIYLGRPTSS